jgi:agmatine/peptidylarginine deiminase
MTTKIFCLLILVFFTFSPAYSQNRSLPHFLTDEEKLLLNSYTPPFYPAEVTDPPPYPVRAMAEWEELQGLMITWTQFTSILAQIIDYAQEDVTVYIVCSDSNSVINYLTNQQIPLYNLSFIQTNYNSIWIRDYGPWTAYTENTDTLNIIDWIYNRPRPADDLIPGTFANFISAPFYAATTAPYNLVHAGGNFMVDGHGTAFSSKLILNENPGKTEAEIDTIMKKFLGINRYIKMNTLPYDVIHHIDMHMKLLDEETLLVGEYPPGVADGPVIEANLAYIRNNFTTCYGREYNVVRIPMPPDGNGQYPNSGGDYRTYTNSIIINKTVIIPTYELRYDTTAFRIYREAMPGYNIVGINSNSIIPLLGAIHCIVKEVGAYNPIQISHARLDDVSDTCQTYPVVAKIKSNSGILQANLYWTTDTTQNFHALPMITSGQDSFRAEIPQQAPGTPIYYYLEAQSGGQKVRTKPVTAPVGLYRFEVLVPVVITEANIAKPDQITLYASYPNPFNNSTTIQFYLPFQTKLSLEIYNSLGERVVILNDNILRSGSHSFRWNADAVGSGIYFYTLQAKGFTETRKILLIK